MPRFGTWVPATIAAWLVALAPAFALDVPRAPGLPIVKVLSCRLEGIAVVCERGGKLLPNRDKKLKLRKEEPKQAPQAAPTTAKPKPKATTSKGAKSKTSKDQSSGASSTPAKDDEAPAGGASIESDGTQNSAVEHSCPPGNVVLEKPNASGSYCEPAGKSEPPKQYSGNGTCGRDEARGTYAGEPGRQRTSGGLFRKHGNTR
jgi:hypothetical protein